MARRHWLIAFACLGVLSGAPGHAQEIDAHTVYERACAGCHSAHAGDFVFESLIASGEGLVGKKTGMPVAAMLSAGHGRLTAEEAEALAAQFIAIHEGGRLFQRKCYVCHQRAVVLSRLKLIEQDGRLVGRYTGRDIESFLAEHGRLTPDEVPLMLDRLSAQFK
jgi:cytochrome c5